MNEWETGDFFYFFFENVLGCDAQFIIFVQDILTNGYHSNFAEPLIKRVKKTNNCSKEMKNSIAEMVVELRIK